MTLYRRQVPKQADVVMAMFLLGNEFTLDEKRSAKIQSIVASEIGDEDAACRYQMGTSGEEP